jgi:hypothetical protein
MNMRSASIWSGFAGLACVGLVVVPSMVGAQDGDGFDGYIQSGTCAAPTDQLVVEFDGDGPHDVRPYVAIDPTGAPVVLGYYGAPSVPGFGVGAIYYSEDQQFSMVISETDTGDPVACGDLLQPDADRHREGGVAVAQLLPVGSGTVHGVAVLERATMQREYDVIPTSARVLLATEAGDVPATGVAGYDGFVQSGPCGAPTSRLRVNLRSEGDHDITPFLAAVPGSDVPVTVAYYGSPGAPGFGIANAYLTDREFSLVVSDTDSGAALACGAILEPDDDKFSEAGLALVRISPLDNSGVDGFAVIDRAPLQRESDVTPTRIKFVLFAPPINAG